MRDWKESTVWIIGLLCATLAFCTFVVTASDCHQTQYMANEAGCAKCVAHAKDVRECRDAK